MSLSTDLVSQFVKATNDTQTKKKETSMKGKVVKITDDSGTASYYVKIDGSDALTPINTLTDMDDGDRVVVEIENHTATVTGNITSPSARIADLKDAEDKIVANTADIGSIKADYVKTGVIEAANGRITNLEAKNADIEKLVAQKATIDDLKAANAEIEDLKVNKADIKSVEANYVNIDFSNIQNAEIKKFYAKFGMMDDVVISNGKVTGTLVGVTIDGDLIQAGTLVADRLVIRTKDGLLYKLNAEALGDAGLAQIEDLTTLQNGLHGAIINDKTIVAEKIKVNDLVAFGATIGGFKIGSDSIHSVVKESVDNTTRGIYMDNDGQFNVGDSKNYIKFYKDENNEYKFILAADELRFGAGRKDLQTLLDDATKGSISKVDVEYCKSASSTELLDRVKVEGVKTVLQRDLKGDNVSIKLQSDNLLLLPYDNNFSNSLPSSETTVTANGVTFKPNLDGSVSIWGTASEQTIYWLRNYYGSDSDQTRIFMHEGTYTLGINTNASAAGSVRLYSNKYKGSVAIYNGAPQTFTLDADSEATLGTFAIVVTTGFKDVTEESPVIAYPILNEGPALKEFTTPKHKSLTDSVSFIPKQTCTISVNGVVGSLLLDEDDTVIINNSLNTIYVDAGLKYRVILSVLLDMDNPQWSTSSPKWEEGSYIWSRTKTTNAEEKVSYSDPVCITGNPGQGVKSITEQYYLSTSEEEPVGGTWSDQQDSWSIGRYIWTRSIIIWSNGRRTETDPVLATSLNEANASAEKATADAEAANNSANDAKTAADSAYSEVAQLKNKMITLVANKDGTTSFVQSASGWNFNFSDLTKSIEDMSKKTAYIDIDETNTGNPRMLFGKVDADSKLELTNETISFIIGSEIPTRITNEGMDTDRINIDNELLIGGFVLKKRPTGHVGFTWKGVDS